MCAYTFEITDVNRWWLMRAPDEHASHALRATARYSSHHTESTVLVLSTDELRELYKAISERLSAVDAGSDGYAVNRL